MAALVFELFAELIFGALVQLPGYLVARYVLRLDVRREDATGLLCTTIGLALWALLIVGAIAVDETDLVRRMAGDIA